MTVTCRAAVAADGTLMSLPLPMDHSHPAGALVVAYGSHALRAVGHARAVEPGLRLTDIEIKTAGRPGTVADPASASPLPLHRLAAHLRDRVLAALADAVPEGVRAPYVEHGHFVVPDARALDVLWTLPGFAGVDAVVYSAPMPDGPMRVCAVRQDEAT